MSGGRVVGGVLVGVLCSLAYSFVAVIVGLPLGAAGSTERATDVLFVLPSLLPVIVAVVGSCVREVRRAAGGFVIGILWGLVPVPALVAAVVVASGIQRL